VNSGWASGAGARAGQARPPIGYGPSSASTITDRRGAAARIAGRSSFELTGIVRGYAGGAFTRSSAGRPPDGGHGRPAPPAGVVESASRAPPADDEASYRDGEEGLLNSRPHHANPEITTKKPRAGSSQTKCRSQVGRCPCANQ